MNTPNLPNTQSDQIFHDGLMAMKAGEMAKAEDCFMQVQQLTNGHLEAQSKLGIVYASQGRLEEATKAFEAAIRMDNDFYLAHHNLSLALMQQGEMALAEQSSRKALSLDPNFLPAIATLSAILQEQGKNSDAMGILINALMMTHHEEKNVVALMESIDALCKRLRKSIAPIFEDVLAQCPDHPHAYHMLNWLGSVYMERGDSEKGIESFRQAITQNENFSSAYHNLGVYLLRLGRYEEAAEESSRAVELNPTIASSYYTLGTALFRLKQRIEAIPLLEKALTLASINESESLGIHKLLSWIYAMQGQNEKVVHHTDYILKQDPTDTNAHIVRSKSVKYTEKDTHFTAMEGFLADPCTERAQAIDLNFAIGKAYEDLKDYPASFQHYQEGNTLRRELMSYSLETPQQFMSQIKKAYPATYFSTINSNFETDITPIFIVGMPRSGTSLVEQILSVHPEVKAMGELQVLDRIQFLNLDMTEQDYAEQIAALTNQDITQLAESYSKHVFSPLGSAKYATDKQPTNFLYIGLIKSMFPHAKIIHCMRNPKDVAISNFRMLYDGLDDPINSRLQWSCDLSEIVGYYKLYYSLMQHWRKVLPDTIYDLNYESLVRDQKAQTQSLLFYCGLPWDNACLEFYDSDRIVATASSYQVKRSIHQSAINNWHVFEKQAGETLASLDNLDLQ